MAERAVTHTIIARETSDGAGVRIRRSLGQRPSARLDPFLMLDEFGSADAGRTTSAAFHPTRTGASRRSPT